MDRPQVGLWRERWVNAYDRLCLIETEQPEKLEDAILEVLADAPRSGAHTTFTPEQIVQIVAIILKKINMGKFIGKRLNKKIEKPAHNESPAKDLLLSKSELQIGNVLVKIKKQLVPHPRARCFCSTSFTIRFTFTTNAVRYACIRMRNRPRYLASRGTSSSLRSCVQ